MKKILLIGLALVVLVVGGATLFVLTYEPASRPAPDIRVEATPERVARGEYIVRNVSVCLDCHSERDWSRFAGPIVEPAGAGGDCWTPEMGFPGTVCAPNLTPDPETGLGNWTDGEILRAFREGIRRDGTGLTPVMPYDVYRNMSDEDAYSVVAYLRTLPAVKRKVQAKSVDFPVSFFFKMAPKPITEPVSAPARGETVEYGEYLTQIAGCQFCHTPQDSNHQPDVTQLFAGGHTFPTPHLPVNSSNLTPARTILKSRDAFIARFRDFADVEKAAIRVLDGRTSVMPWFFYAQMTDEDLGAIYQYLETVPPIRNSVEKYPAVAAR